MSPLQFSLSSQSFIPLSPHALPAESKSEISASSPDFDVEEDEMELTQANMAACRFDCVQNTSFVSLNALSVYVPTNRQVEETPVLTPTAYRASSAVSGFSMSRSSTSQSTFSFTSPLSMLSPSVIHESANEIAHEINTRTRSTILPIALSSSASMLTYVQQIEEEQAGVDHMHNIDQTDEKSEHISKKRRKA